MFALVKDNQVVRTIREESIEWNGLTYSNVFLLTPDERKAAGIYDFVSVPIDVPAGKKAQGTTVEVGDGIVTETPIYVDKSEEEVAMELQVKREGMAVTPWQIRKALNALDLRTAVETAMEGADPTTKDAWQYATEFVRTDPLVSAFGAVLGKTDEDLDALFTLAKTL